MTFSVNTATFHNAGGTFFDECGHNGLLCVTPRQKADGELFDIPGNCDMNAGGPNEVWTVIFGGSAIELPVSAVTTTLGNNFGSQHAIICGALS
ncbi:MAG TPA: hypothetical protein VFB06_33945 [Streptosporangiaceae bacterium]|nr:hypothetical protein [Streptosporangiaceae bacterium]